MWLQEVKAGDKLVVGISHTLGKTHYYVLPVKRVTPKQVIVSIGNAEKRFRKADGGVVGDNESGWMRTRYYLHPLNDENVKRVLQTQEDIKLAALQREVRDLIAENWSNLTREQCEAIIEATRGLSSS